MSSADQARENLVLLGRHYRGETPLPQELSTESVRLAIEFPLPRGLPTQSGDAEQYHEAKNTLASICDPDARGLTAPIDG
ncbi:predicted protein [Uncinocarpus reesii 1704]|uniref:Uncharacterized protein n=1 Tax=Uncinocarpus reesii (strain UAMH 1704) TaxID=336963 RepID=C4JJH5_UNCRE|nr:uncharacterized protein UREG_01782 [Uncinocarpus reesii 1704]EEP76933.1 predicted protein [Uncinocarpus reesii 1704]